MTFNAYTLTPDIFLEQDNSLAIRVLTLLLSVLGAYPQYKAVRTVLMGRGWIRGDWEQEHMNDKKKLYAIEPVIESLIQVNGKHRIPLLSYCL